ncbi:MAG: FAD-binding protein [Bacteroidetes bacterium]|nr:MAG: FAD-binding protein [Bacteroidota bacterium]
MSLPQIRPTNAIEWTNRHDTFTQPIDNLFDLINGNTGNGFDDYNAMTEAIQSLLAKAIAENITIRALGGGWSFSNVAAAEGWILNTKMLNMIFPIRKAQSVSPNYTGTPNDLLFAQCGNSIQELNNWLKQNKRSLKTSGASNGQTIVGCFSTGTHGSAIDTGSVQDFIVGIHIITGPDTHIWLERGSYPVVSDLFLEKFKTNRVADDELFNAALVSFGSFGFIHGVMIETEPIYLLECYRKKIPIDDTFKHIMETLDFSNANFIPNGNERPFHFQAVIDQYKLSGGAYATIMYKRSYTDNYQPPVDDFNKAGPGDDMAAVVGIITDIVPALTHLLVSKLVKTSYTLYEGDMGTSGEIFRNNNIRGRLLSTAIGIPLDRVWEVNNLLIKLNKTSGPFSGIFSYRYVKKSSATLAFTRFAPTCILELDGTESATTRNFYAAVWNELEARNIPYTFHWGKIHNLDEPKTRKMYGAGMDEWIKQRNKILAPETMKIFNTQSLKDCGLDKILPALRPF